MVRSLLVSLWIVSATLGATYFGATMQGEKPAGETSQAAKAAPVKLRSMTVPVVSQGALQGFVLTQVTISARPDLLKNLPQPSDLLLNDEVFKTIYGEEQIDFKRMEKLDLAKLSLKIRENINKRAGAPVVEDVYIQELHYMTKHDASAEGQKPRH
jgi:hypothetical protein